MTTSLTFRAQFAALTPAEAVTVLGWLLEPAQGDPQPDLPDALLDALHPLSEAYAASYAAINACVAPASDNEHLVPWHVVDAYRGRRGAAA